MADLSWFDPASVPEDSFEPLPAGEYKACIKSSEMKDTKAGTGRYLRVTLEVLDGQYKGRVVFDNLNLHNPNAEAVRMAQQSLKKICEATGVLRLRDSAELHGIPMAIRLAVSPGKDGHGPSNDVKDYKQLGAATSPVATASVATADTPPWSS